MIGSERNKTCGPGKSRHFHRTIFFGLLRSRRSSAVTWEQFLNGAYHVGPAAIKIVSIHAIEPPFQPNDELRHSGSVDIPTSKTRWL
jgi:hypothetical protein